MAEVTEIWVWTVWEVTPVDAGDEGGASSVEAPAAEATPDAAAEPAPEPAAPTPAPAAGTETQPPADAPPIAGYAVETSDGHIGTVDEVSYDAGTGAIVVDTGHWIFGKKRMVPAGMIEKIDRDARVVRLSCTKADVKAAPDFDPGRADDAAHRAEVGEHYEAKRATSGPGSEAGAAPD